MRNSILLLAIATALFLASLLVKSCNEEALARRQDGASMASSLRTTLQMQSWMTSFCIAGLAMGAFGARKRRQTAKPLIWAAAICAPLLAYAPLHHALYADFSNGGLMTPLSHRLHLLVNYAMLATGVLLCVAFFRCPHQPYPEGYCQYCGYDLTENTSGRCPECGKTFKPIAWKHARWKDQEVISPEQGNRTRE